MDYFIYKINIYRNNIHKKLFGNIHNINNNKFIKNDDGKIRYDLVPPSAIKSLAEVLTKGLDKYPPNNWKYCENPDRYIASMYRHIEAWRSGEIYDKETGLSHLKHVLANVSFLIEMEYSPSTWKRVNIK
ncbi:hypothetical protein [Dasineura jujubifolia toursvirus 2a]|nr:hypothetical protein [Dasineura jujubifolia toursvirus 2a]